MTPEGWKDLTLADIANVVSGVGFPREHQGSQAGRFPFFKVSDMNTPGNERELRVAANTVDAALLDSLKGKLHPPGTVVFPKVGAALLTNKRRRLVAPSCFDNNVMGLVATGCDPDYFYVLMQTVDLAKHVQPGAVPSINGSMVRSIRVLVPTLPEQSKIAAILSSVDDAIEKTQMVINQVQVVKRGLMQELLTRGLPGRHTRFKQTEIGEIPEAWRLLPLECFIEDGPYNGLYRPQRNYGEGTPIVRIDAFDNGVRLRRPQLRRVFLEPRDVERFAVNLGDILINRVNSMSHLAKCALAVSFDEPTVYESNIMRLSLDDSRLTTEFGFRWLSSEQVKTHLRRKAKRAVAQASINQNDVLTIPTPCPPRSEQRRIAEVIRIIEQRLESEIDALEGLKKFKLALMSVVLTGELRVTPDPETR